MWRCAKHIIFKTISNALEHNILIFGGYAAYSALLAFFPFLIFLMSVAGLMVDAAAAQKLIDYFLAYMPAQIVAAIAPAIRGVLESQSFGLLTLGGVGALWISSSGIEGLRFGLNQSYGISEFRPLWKRRLQSIGLVFAGSFIFLLLALALIVWPLLTDFLARYFTVSLSILADLTAARFALAAIVLFIFFGILYRTLPNRKHRWKNVCPGAMLATVLWLGLAQLFSIYLANFANYDATYGSIGGVIITLIFFSYSATVILLGAELNNVLEESGKTPPQ